MTDLARLQRLRGQLAAEQAKVVRADQHPRPDLDHLRVTPHNGIAAGLEIAIFFADHHLREAREEDRTTPDNPATSSDTADNEQLRADAEAWRHKAVRRALAISKLRGTIDACTDLADEPVTDRTGWGDGYRAAIGDLREVLREFGHIEAGAEQAATETETTPTTAPPR